MEKHQQLLAPPEGDWEHSPAVDDPLRAEQEWTERPGGRTDSSESHFESEASPESLSLGGRGDWAGLRFWAADLSIATWWPLALAHSSRSLSWTDI